MVYISRLKLRNFKSFKAADVELPQTFTCFAGPNGSGKSNLCDAIRFVMGETSLKSLRAKKVRELIHTGSKSAEVTIFFHGRNDGRRCEIKRAIRDDGKIRYRLDGKRTTRGAIMEALRKHNMDESGRNTIAQGEVQRIISMNGKERRAIIDSVAGIADFEAKKKEALGELQLVEDRIKEARLVVGERKAFLDELGREKETALMYVEAKKKLNGAKGTLVRKEVERLERELGDATAADERLAAARAKTGKEAADIDAAICAVEAKRAKISGEMQAKQKTNALIRKLEELRASCSSKKQLIEDKELFVKKARAESAALSGELERERHALAGLEKGLAGLQKELREAGERLGAEGGLTEDAKISGARQALEAHERELASARGRMIALEAEIKSKRELMEAKKAEEAAIAAEAGSEESDGSETERLRKEAAQMAAEIDKSFSRTKEINAKISELDRELLELREKATVFRVRSSPQLANPALSFIAELKKTGGSGIHGTVADLISFDPKYSAAVEAAGGARLLYVVVESADKALEAIEKLKKAKAGRATFIPLDSVRPPPAAKTNGFHAVLEAVQFREEIRRAAEYVFADTLLVDTVADARKLGTGSGRMVTLDGEIFERSGIISGGRAQSGLLSGNQLRKVEQEMADVKGARESLVQELYSLREEESAMRSRKAQLEIAVKTMEMKRQLEADKRREMEQALKRKGQLHQEIGKLGELAAAKAHEKEMLGKEISAGESRLAALREKLKAAEEESRKSAEAASSRRAELSAAVSSLRATIDGKRSECDLRKKEAAGREERLKKAEGEEKEALARIHDAKKAIEAEEAEFARLEESMSSASREVEKLFGQMKEFENELEALGKKRGENRLELDRIAKDLGQLEVKKATAATRLEDLRAEFEAYKDAEVLKAGKEELRRMVEEAEKALAGLGNVNMAAIEMYGRKKAEIEEAEGKIGQLDRERGAICAMISEIDEHKKEAFFETFQAVSDNFTRMFDYVNVGQGHLYLSDPAAPFESGLFIKLRRNNQDHSLDALSGGEKTLVALMFIFALQHVKPAPFYILDEVDAALDRPNSSNLADLVSKMSRESQFILVSHNDTVMSHSDSVIGVTKTGGVSKLVGIKLKQVVSA